MKKKKGFTLIELLAVIVILAIIALIAVPIILNIIERARKGAAQDSANGVRKAAQLYYSSSLIDNFNGNNITFECNGKKCEASTGEVLAIDGTIPSNGKIEIKSNGKMTFSNIIINGYSCEIPETGNSVCTKNNSESTDDSAITLGEIEVTVNSIVIPYTLNGETSSDVALNDTLNNTTLLAYNDSELETKEILLLNDNEANVTCEYGTSENYGESGILQDNSCYITGLDANTTYYYKLTVTDSNGEEHTKKGSVGTSAYVPGEVIYYNPFGGETCYDYNLSNSLTGYNGDNGNSSNEYQNACLKWYIITTDDDSSKETIDVILDHNTTPLVAWNMNATNNSAGMSDVITSLNNDTALWNGVLDVRLITADEIANITGASSENTIKWSSSKTFKYMQDTTVDINVDLENESSWFYFDGKGSTYNKSANGWQLATAKSPGASKYAWLYDNLFECRSEGCNYEDNNLYSYLDQNSNSGTDDVLGYWTSTPITELSEAAWVIESRGSLSRLVVNSNNIAGVRPVITISKDSLKVKKTNSDDYIPEFTKPSVTLESESSTIEQITVDFTVTSDFEINKIICEYGTDTSYGNTGVVTDNSCTISNLEVGTEYFYRVTAIDRFNKSNFIEGSVTTDSESIENIQYISGDSVKLGGYNWHVISDDGTYVTLLMDAGQVSDMNHCTGDLDASTDCGVDATGQYHVYSWDKSLIREYLNGEFLSNLENKIANEIISTEICADPSRTDVEMTYGGYLRSEVNAIFDASCSEYVSDKVRLISPSEYLNMSPYYNEIDLNYPNTGYITKLSTSSDYASWFYCSSNACGGSFGFWWSMGAYSSGQRDYIVFANLVDGEGYFGVNDAQNLNAVRPVITIQKQ